MQKTMHLRVVLRMESIYPVAQTKTQQYSRILFPTPTSKSLISRSCWHISFQLQCHLRGPSHQHPSLWTPWFHSFPVHSHSSHSSQSDLFKHKSEHVSLLLKTLQRLLISLHMKPILFTWVYKVSWATFACTVYSLLAVFELHWSFFLHLKLAKPVPTSEPLQ